jgi:UDP-N-acetyl-D-galactosamine dehydrogenase
VIISPIKAKRSRKFSCSFQREIYAKKELIMNTTSICVVGLGYVGLPLAIELSKHFKTTGFDINTRRVNTLLAGQDPNEEVDSKELTKSSIVFSSDPEIIKKAGFVIVAVPTPVDDHNNPDLTPVISASETVGRFMSKGTIVVYESTVYPGVTEDECVPVLEKASGYVWKKDFFVGYSPERINPGDKVHTFANIMKIVSGDTPDTLDAVARVYAAAVKPGVYKAPSIKVAEAAKVIENTQRDINIALMNELRLVFDRMHISTRDVLEAAKTKWNFMPFEPGLVGGHCIGVDPYYLAYKAEELGHHPQLILAGRRINDAMGRYFARDLIKMMIQNDINIKHASVLVLGLTFKENVPDIRNSKVVDIIKELQDFGIAVDVWEPMGDHEDIHKEYGITTLSNAAEKKYDAVILAVKHTEFIEMGEQKLREFVKPDGVFYDIKEFYEKRH